MNSESTKKIYAAYSKVYDSLFKRFFFPRIKHALLAMNIKPGDRVLDLGIGTGLSLPIYPRDCTVTGVDLSSKMLTQARQKIEKHGMHHIEVMEMDAMDLSAFPEDSFDKVFISHVVSVVSDPYRVMQEVRRVCRRDGDVVVINHFRSNNKLLGQIDSFLNPIFKRIGWRSDLGLNEFINGAGLTVREKYMLKKFDFWHMIFAVNIK